MAPHWGQRDLPSLTQSLCSRCLVGQASTTKWPCHLSLRGAASSLIIFWEIKGWEEAKQNHGKYEGETVNPSWNEAPVTASCILWLTPCKDTREFCHHLPSGQKLWPSRELLASHWPRALPVRLFPDRNFGCPGTQSPWQPLLLRHWMETAGVGRPVAEYWFTWVSVTTAASQYLSRYPKS